MDPNQTSDDRHPADETRSDDTALWRLLQNFQLDDSTASFTFTDRLARDNGWSRPFARRVVTEYRKFLFLGQVSGHPVTPSDEVDQAWHLHLTYTRSYWDELCANVLGAPFHHGPTMGGTDEGTKFDDWYARTLDSYRTFFGHEPPADIWPPAAIRFGEAPNYVRLNTRRTWLVPKPTAPARKTTGAIAIPAATMLLAGCSGASVATVVGVNAVAGALALVGVLAVIGLIVWIARKPGVGTGQATGDSGGGDNSFVAFGAYDNDHDYDHPDGGGNGGSDSGGGFFSSIGDMFNSVGDSIGDSFSGDSDGGGGSGCGGSGCGGCGGG